MSNKIPTAKKHLKNNIDYVLEGDMKQDIIDAMISYTKLHVKAALKKASENYARGSLTPGKGLTVKEAILNSYPEDLIQ